MRKATFNRIDALDYGGNEAMNTICSNLTFAGRNVKKIVFTSCDASEGKSFITLQTAQNLARRGKRVVLVDADLRRSFLIRRHRLQTDGEWKGLAHYLAGYESLDDVLYETNLTGLCLMPVGRDLSNPVPFLDSPYFGKLLDDLAERFDVVLVDTPPIGLVIDAAEIAQFCDGAVFVVEYGKTRRRDVASAQKQIQQAACPVLGCIINRVTLDSISAKKYYKKSYYSHYGMAYEKSAKRDGSRQKE